MPNVLDGAISLEDRASKSIRTVKTEMDELNRSVERNRRVNGSGELVSRRGLRESQADLEQVTNALDEFDRRSGSIGRNIPPFIQGIVPGLSELVDVVDVATFAFPRMGTAAVAGVGAFGVLAAGSAAAVLALNKVWDAMEAGEQRQVKFKLISDEFGNAQEAIDQVQAALGNTISEETVIPILVRLSKDDLLNDINEVSTLAAIVKERARETGQEFTTLMDQVVTAIGKGDAATLENLGVLKNANGALVTYAESVGKNVNQLTKQERAQALTNGAIKDGAATVNNAKTPVTELTTAQDRLKTAFADSGTAFNEWITSLAAPGATAAAEFWTGQLNTMSMLVSGFGSELNRSARNRTFRAGLSEDDAPVFDELEARRLEADSAVTQRAGTANPDKILKIAQTDQELQRLIQTARQADALVNSAIEKVQAGFDIKELPEVKLIVNDEALEDAEARKAKLEVDLAGVNQNLQSTPNNQQLLGVKSGIESQLKAENQRIAEIMREREAIFADLPGLAPQTQPVPPLPTQNADEFKASVDNANLSLAETTHRIATIEQQIKESTAAQAEFERLNQLLIEAAARKQEFERDPVNAMIAPEAALQIKALRDELKEAKERYAELMTTAERQPDVTGLKTWQDEMTNVQAKMKKLAFEVESAELRATAEAKTSLETFLQEVQRQIDALVASGDLSVDISALKRDLASLSEPSAPTQPPPTNQPVTPPPPVAPPQAVAEPATPGIDVELLTRVRASYTELTAATNQLAAAEQALRDARATGDAVLIASAEHTVAQAQSYKELQEAQNAALKAEFELGEARQIGSENAISTAEATLKQAEANRLAAQSAFDKVSADLSSIEAAKALVAAQAEQTAAQTGGYLVDQAAVVIKLALAQVTAFVASAKDTETAATTTNTAATTTNTAAADENAQVMSNQAQIAGILVDELTGLPVAFDRGALSADGFNSAVADLNVQLHNLEFAASNAAFAVSGRLVGALGIAGALRFGTQFAGQARELREGFQAINEDRLSAGKNPFGAEVFNVALGELQKNFQAQASDIEAATRQAGSGVTKQADDTEGAADRINKALESIISGLLRPTTGGLIDLDSLLPREDAIDESARRMADIAVKGFQSPWFEGMKSLFSADVLGQGEGAIKEAAARFVRDHQEGVSFALFDSEKAVDEVIERLKAKQAQGDFVESIREQVKAALPDASDLDIADALGIDTTQERATAASGAIRQSATDFTLSFNEILEQLQTLSEEDSPFVDMLSIDEDGKTTVAQTGTDTATDTGEAIVNQMSSGAYGTRAIDQIKTQIETKKQEIQKSGRDVGDWLGGALLAKFGQDVPPGLLDILVEELLPRLEQAQAQESERKAGGAR